MMKRIIFLSITALLLGVCAEAQTYVTIRTNMGTMKARLFDDTPKHRDEFVRLAKSGHFNGTLFYRSVKNFVIQGGSSDSRNAAPGQHIGYGEEAVNIDSEIDVKKHFHRFGALCAPRQPDKVNLFKISDISQFYIVRGRVFTADYLDKLEKSHNAPIIKSLREQYYYPYRDELAQLKTTDAKAYNARVIEIKDKLEFEYSISGYLKFTDEQREAYTTVGGTPELDGEYTVFGQVTEGLDVIRKINNLQVDKNDRPLTDVRIIEVKVLQ